MNVLYESAEFDFLLVPGLLSLLYSLHNQRACNM